MMSNKADMLLQDIKENHLPRVMEGIEKGYIDENQILVIYDHAVRIRILNEEKRHQATRGSDALLKRADTSQGSSDAV